MENNLNLVIDRLNNNFINGNLSDCKIEIQELGKTPMTLMYVALQMRENDDFVRWVFRNIEVTKDVLDN